MIRPYPPWMLMLHRSGGTAFSSQEDEDEEEAGGAKGKAPGEGSSSQCCGSEGELMPRVRVRLTLVWPPEASYPPRRLHRPHSVRVMDQLVVSCFAEDCFRPSSQACQMPALKSDHYPTIDEPLPPSKTQHHRACVQTKIFPQMSYRHICI